MKSKENIMRNENRLRLLELKINGFKSIGKEQTLRFGDVNVLIGANGTGKSNLVSFFKLLSALAAKELQMFIGTQGFADSLLYYGTKVTDRFSARLFFGNQLNVGRIYEFALTPSFTGQMMFAYEKIDKSAHMVESHERVSLRPLGTGHKESLLTEAAVSVNENEVIALLSNILSYQFHDTSAKSPIRQPTSLHDNRHLHSDGSNLPAFLYQMTHVNSGKDYYKRIVNRIRMIFPQFKDFFLEPANENPDMIQLKWKTINRGNIFGAHQLSDGTLRFMALATLLLQPPYSLPNVIVIDEPELGLHPEALIDLVGMIKIAAQNCQIILSTQSSFLLDFFNVNDIIVVETKDDSTVFNRLDQEKLSEWVKDYTLSELWEKNLIGGRP